MGSSEITRSDDRFGGRAYIAGTNITVHDIVATYQTILDALVIQEILTNCYPHLTERQIRDALDYYRDHPEEIDKLLAEDREVYRTHERIGF